MQPTSFNPPVRTLMGPGPSDVHPRILEAMSRPTIGHLDPMFIKMMDELKELLQYTYLTKNAMTMPVSAPGSAGRAAGGSRGPSRARGRRWRPAAAPSR